MHRFAILLGLNLVLALSITGSITAILYDAAFDQISARLLNTVESQKQLMVAVEEFDKRYSSTFPGGSRSATLSQIEASHTHFESFGETGEFTVAELAGDQIVFIFRQRYSGLDKPAPVSFTSELAEPMRRALQGQTGVVIAPDYRGKRVLAAYTPVEAMDLGIVAKIDISEIRAPFINAAIIGVLVSLVLFGGSTVVFFRIVSPITEEIKESERLYRELIEGQAELVCRSGHDGVITFANESFCHYFGKASNQLIGSKITEFIPESQRAKVLEERSQISPVNRSATHKYEVLEGTGELRWMQWTDTLLLDGNSTEDEFVSVGRDITEERAVAEAFRRVERGRLVLLRAHEILVHIDSPEDLFDEVCRLLVEEGGYKFVWIGLVGNDEAKTVTPAARHGPASEYLDEIRVAWDKSPAGMGPAGQAIRSGQPVVGQNLDTDPGFSAFREAAHKQGFRSTVALPLRLAGEVIGSMNIYSIDREAFDSEELGLLMSLAEDVSFGVEALNQSALREDAEQKFGLSEAKLKESLFATIAALANTIEQRDPYTAGHQRQVAELAAAIAKKMNLSEHTVEGIRMGGVVHDIGKISVPAEILNKPSRLTKTEFDLITVHPETGRDIVADINFEWPIAEMIVQHHERLDGSGYPDGLKGDEICLEARIIAVADTVDAIISHRPYRPGRSIDVAISELLKYRVKWYDPQVVDACVALIQEDGFFNAEAKSAGAQDIKEAAE